jgi:hypothetical protein
MATIKRSKERVDKTGEIFTPPELINELLGKLPEEIFSDPSKTFLEPAAGDGNFLVEVINKKMEHGMTPIQAIKSTYAIEMMPDNVKKCKERILELVGDTEENKQILNKQIVCAEVKWEKQKNKLKSYFIKRVDNLEDLF